MNYLICENCGVKLSDFFEMKTTDSIYALGNEGKRVAHNYRSPIYVESYFLSRDAAKYGNELNYGPYGCCGPTDDSKLNFSCSNCENMIARDVHDCNLGSYLRYPKSKVELIEIKGKRNLEILIELEDSMGGRSSEFIYLLQLFSNNYKNFKKNVKRYLK